MEITDKWRDVKVEHKRLRRAWEKRKSLQKIESGSELGVVTRCACLIKNLDYKHTLVDIMYELKKMSCA